MLLFWRIRYLDSRDKQFKDRDLTLDTDTLDPIPKAAIEAVHALRETESSREMLRYRRLFQERPPTNEEWRAVWQAHRGWSGGIFISDYFEDETGHELRYKQMAVALTGNPEAILFPPGTTQNDIEYAMAVKSPIDLSKLTLPEDQLTILGYFARDLRELLSSAFLKDGPGTLQGPWSDGLCRYSTAVSDEEIRSFVTIFRRLYMQDEPANFVKAIAVFSEILQVHPLAKWVDGIASQYNNALNAEPQTLPGIGNGKLPFSCKRLIDVFLYTQFAHQPNERRTRQFHECLTAVGGDKAVLTWLFATELWKCALHFHNGGGVVAEFYDQYCRQNGINSQILPSMRTDHPGLGGLEKKEAKRNRILGEEADKLAKILWEEAGRPEGGHLAFVKPALEQLISSTRSTDASA